MVSMTPLEALEVGQFFIEIYHGRTRCSKYMVSLWRSETAMMFDIYSGGKVRVLEIMSYAV